MKDFVHLHTHTVHSLLDGFTKIPDLVQVVKKHGMRAIAITDHGNMSGIPTLWKEAKIHDVKPIAGLEAYICEDRFLKEGGRSKKTPYYHITLLARTLEGYRNLCRLSSISYLEGFYSKPRIDLDALARHARGITCLSGCVGGWPQSLIVEGRTQEAVTILHKLKSIFGREFYLELMRTGERNQEIVTKAFLLISKRMGIPLVVTADSHYTLKEDHHDHDTLFCMGIHKAKMDADRMRFIPGQYYVRSPGEMHSLGLPTQACNNTLQIAEGCELYDLPKSGGLPKIQGDIEALALQGLLERVPDFDNYYLDRLSYEIRVVKELNYERYFLIVHDIMRFARENHIVHGWGRGSSAGSLLSYCLYITHLDPIVHRLYFERFLNPARREPPDIDLDFSDEQRHLVINYIKDTYGNDNVSHIATLGTLGPRQCIIDACKVLGKDEYQASTAIKMLPHDPTTKIADILANKELSAAMLPVVGADVMHCMERFEGIPRHASMHASGIIIDSAKIGGKIPFMCRSAKNPIPAVQYQYDDLHELGYEKFDILGVKTLGAIAAACESAQVDIMSIPLDDKWTYNLLSSGKTVGVFQLESWGYRKFLQVFKPKTFTDVMMINALYRPGPMQGGKGLDEIVARRHGIKEVEYLHDSLRTVLEETYGVMVYQEQVMATVRILAGWDLARADFLRWAIGKKKIDELKGLRKEFIRDCMGLRHSQAFAEEAFKQVEYFSRYGWNKAHSAAYGMVTYACAYLKANHPIHFMAALMNAELGDHDRIRDLIRECAGMNISLQRPHVNTPNSKFQPHPRCIIAGFSIIKGLGMKASQALMDEGQKKRFISVQELRERIPRKVLNKTMFELLAKNGAFRGLPETHPEAVLLF